MMEVVTGLMRRQDWQEAAKVIHNHCSESILGHIGTTKVNLGLIGTQCVAPTQKLLKSNKDM